jgi:lactoylglutathione lyase
MADTVAIEGLAHVGIRVHDVDRAMAFYALLGFEKTLGPLGPENVMILEHASGLEINLVVNAPEPAGVNVLMDGEAKPPGITHIALSCPDIDAARARLEAAGIAISGGPVQFPTGARAIFVRDPDRNVIELNQRP